MGKRALIAKIVVGSALAAGNAQAVESRFALMPGLGASVNLGEQSIAPALAFESEYSSRDRRKHVETVTLYDAVNKYTGAGWLAQGSATAMLFFAGGVFAVAGPSFTYRDGGAYTKKTVFVSAGGGFEFNHLSSGRASHKVYLLVGTQAVGSQTSQNRLRTVQFIYRADVRLRKQGRWALRSEASLEGVSYLNSDDFGPRHIGGHMYLWTGLALLR